MFASVTIRYALVCASLVVLMPRPHAQDERFWSFLRPGTVITRCAETSDSHRQASQRLQQLDEQVDRLKPSDSVTTMVNDLHALLKTECFLPVAETERIPRPDTAVSLKQWWFEAGGREWLDSFLDLPELGDVRALKPHIAVPPDVRRTLHLESHSDHPLRRFLCPLTESACGATTRGWRLRADAYFQVHALAQKNEPTPLEDRVASGELAISGACLEAASGRPESEKYEVWRDCIEEHRTTRVTLPLGEFRAPQEGWLVISGRRGHYSFCDSTRAYDLETGAAYISDSCSGLALNADGSVDRDATNKARKARIAVGHISAQNLQEAVWMMLFRGETQQLQVQAEYFPLPAGLRPRFTVHPPSADHDVSVSPAMFSTAQTILAWQWIPTSGTGIAGELTWPNSYDAAEDHAVSLLNIAESGFVEGCARRRPPEVSLLRSAAAHLNDVSAEALGELATDYASAVKLWRDVGRCEPGRQ